MAIHPDIASITEEHLDVLKRSFQRERLAREQAERLLEEKSKELFVSNQRLINESNSKRIDLAEMLNHVVELAADRSATEQDILKACIEVVCQHTTWPLGHVAFCDNPELDTQKQQGFWYFSEKNVSLHFLEKAFITRLTEAIRSRMHSGLMNCLKKIFLNGLQEPRIFRFWGVTLFR